MMRFLLLIVFMILAASIYKVYSNKPEHIIEIKEPKQTKEKKVTETMVVSKKEKPIKEPIVQKIKPVDRNVDVIVTEKNSEKPVEEKVVDNKKVFKEVIVDVSEKDSIPSKESDYMANEANDTKILSKDSLERMKQIDLENLHNNSENIGKEDMKRMEQMMKINLELMNKDPQDITEEDMKKIEEVMNPDLEAMDANSPDL